MFSKKMKMIIIGAFIICISIGGIALLKSNLFIFTNNAIYNGVDGFRCDTANHVDKWS